MYYTYILHNAVTDKYYVGFTKDLKNRLEVHNKGKVKSTKSNTNYSVEWYCAFKTQKQAIEFEQYLKTGSGIAFMKKRFFKFKSVAVEKDNESGE